MTEYIVYLGIGLGSLIISLVCLSREIREHDNRSPVKDDIQTCREIHDPRRLSFDDLALRTRDSDDPLVAEILEQTRDIRERRKALSSDGRETAMREYSSDPGGVETCAGTEPRSLG